MEKRIVEMNRQEILGLNFIPDPLRLEEIVHISKKLGAFWEYDYQSSKSGMHAELKSGLHSDAFFASRFLLQFRNIRRIIALQMIRKLQNPEVDYVAGVPSGATSLAEEIGYLLGIPGLEIVKKDSRILINSSKETTGCLMLVEDFCTQGTGIKEMISEIKSSLPKLEIFPYIPVILNRGGLKKVAGSFIPLSIADIGINKWEPERCPLCRRGSVPVKPKENNYNWNNLINSQT